MFDVGVQVVIKSVFIRYMIFVLNIRHGFRYENKLI